VDDAADPAIDTLADIGRLMGLRGRYHETALF